MAKNVKQRTGYVYFDKSRNSWTARLTYTDERGQRRNFKRQVANKTEGKDLLKKKLRELEDHGPRLLDGDKVTFEHLAQTYEGLRLVAPVYDGEKKISGLRSHHIQKVYLRELRAFFGKRLIRSITHADLENFKAARLATPKRNGSQRAIASVNRELTLLRTVFNYAVQAGWLIRNPFAMGESLISVAQENKRTRILTTDEEARLLNACIGERAHLRPLIIAALDTAMRRGELLRLVWSDVDFAAGLIRLRATTTKTMRARTVGITDRLRAELERLWEASPRQMAISVFGIRDFKKGFNTARKLAGLEDLHFHDLRHSATTRIVRATSKQGSAAPLEMMAITGHTQTSTFTRYINADDATARIAAEALNLMHAENEPEQSDLIN
jgi:integrase